MQMNIAEAKAKLSELIAAAERGEDVVIAREGRPIVRFDPKMTWDAAPTGSRGGQQAYGDEAIQTCLTLKVLFGLPLRQTAGFVASLLRLAGLDWSVPDYSTACRR